MTGTCPNYIVRFPKDLEDIRAERIPCTLPFDHKGPCSYADLMKIGKRP
jgi:hypothetical protein